MLHTPGERHRVKTNPSSSSWWKPQQPGTADAGGVSGGGILDPLRAPDRARVRPCSQSAPGFGAPARPAMTTRFWFGVDLVVAGVVLAFVLYGMAEGTTGRFNVDLARAEVVFGEPCNPPASSWSTPCRSEAEKRISIVYAASLLPGAGERERHELMTRTFHVSEFRLALATAFALPAGAIVLGLLLMVTDRRTR